MRRKSKPIVFLEILVLLFIAALTFTGFGLADECEEPPVDGDGPPPPPPPDGDSVSLSIQQFDAVCLGDTRQIQISGSPSGANVTLKLESSSGDARFYGPNGETELSFSGLPYTATIYGQAASTVVDGITLRATMTYGGSEQAVEAFSVLELKSLQVTNATQQSGGCYLATVGSGDVVITAITQPTLNEYTLVEDVLTWSGGQPDGRLRRRVSRATPGATIVTAGCEPTSKSVTIAVVEECGENANIEPGYVRAGPATISGGAFGETVFPTIPSQAIDIDAKACLDSTAKLWRIRVNSVTYRYFQSITDQGRTRVYTANDAVVTASTYCEILRNFTPLGDNPPKPLYETYVALDCVQMHEDQHVAEWKNAFDDAWDDPDVGEAKIEALTAAFVCGDRDTAEEARNALQPWIADALNDTITRARSKWVGLDPPEGGSQAFWVEAGCLAGLRQAILLRAQNENWPSCP